LVAHAQDGGHDLRPDVSLDLSPRTSPHDQHSLSDDAVYALGRRPVRGLLAGPGPEPVRGHGADLVSEPGPELVPDLGADLDLELVPDLAPDLGAERGPELLRNQGARLCAYLLPAVCPLPVPELGPD